MAVVIGLLHPGEMGSAIGAALRAGGSTVLWASEGRSPATHARGASAGLEDVGSVAELVARADLIFSVCPPHAAREVARSAADFAGIYVDANAVSPATARELAGRLPRFVDGGIVGPPPLEAGTTRLYLSGPEAGEVAGLFEGTTVDARVVSEAAGDASAVKMAYAAWTKGTAALLLGIRALARAEGVDDALLAEWALSIPELQARSERAARSAGGKGWRWVAEMEEIAETFAAAGLPDGFHAAAAEIFLRTPRLEDATLDDVLDALK
jgi:3-hydroxyisobutyrate dehydrogenase-like beta-hydroxyacid dehydrogenase